VPSSRCGEIDKPLRTRRSEETSASPGWRARPAAVGRRQVSADGSAVAVTTVEYDATISVRDHGPGVPDDLLGAIFEPFVRVEGGRSRARGGVGLGLAIARRAIGLHRGTIKAQNANPGLLVQIELPGAVELLPETKAISEPCRTSRRTSKNSRC
jgi:signal transduction histidine kinase